MARSGVLAVLLLAAVLLAASWQVGQGAMITCGQVVSLLRPCLPYATGTGPITDSCCEGVRSLNSKAGTSADRKTACNCLKNQVSNIKGIKTGVLAGIPGQCKVNVPYAISPSTDCSKVN